MLPTPTAANSSAVPSRSVSESIGEGRAGPSRAPTTISATTSEPLEADPPFELRGQDAEHGEADRRHGADEADDRTRGTAKSSATWSRIGDRDATRRAQREREQDDADEGESPPAPERAGGGTHSYEPRRARGARGPRTGAGGQDSCEPSTQARYSSETVPVM